MTAAQLMLPANRAFDSNGFPGAGATVKLYQSGTTTPANFYADAALTIVLGSTLTANSAGRLVIPAYQDRFTPFRLKVFDEAGDELDDIDPFYFGSTYTSIFSTASTNVATRTAMEAIVGVAGAVVNLTEVGREGQFIFSSDNFVAKFGAPLTTIDPQQGIYVAPSIDTTGASGAWVRQFAGPADFRWFGAVADCTAAGTGTSNTAAFDAARTALIAAGRGWLHIPKQPTAYRFATPPAQIHDQIKITGDGWSYNPGQVGATTYSGVAAYNGTVLCFDADVPGFQFVAYTDNNANATTFEFQSALGSVVRDIMLYSAGGVGTTAHGIERRAAVELDNVRIEGFAGYGLKTLGWSAGAVPYGSVDSTTCRAVSCRFNKLSGFYTEGDDVNVNHFDTCDSAVNGGVGFLDKGSAGNTYTSCHTSSNNQSFGTPAGYSAAQRTQNTTDWAGLSDQQAGSYVTTSGVGAHVFDGCYVEIGVGHKHEIIYPSIISGGILASTERTAAAAANPCRIDNAATINGIDTIVADRSHVLDIQATSRAQVSNSGGNAVFRLTGSGTFSNLQLYGAGVAANGLDVLTGSGASYFSADSFTFRNAAQATTFFTADNSGLNIATGALKINGTTAIDASRNGSFASVASTGTIISSGGGVGYATGAGGTVTQATSKSTGVTLNKLCGQITMNGAALAANTGVSFTVTNNQIAATDTIDLVLQSGNATAGTYNYQVDKVSAGSFVIWVKNISAGSLSESLVFNFSVKKAVAA